jgi:hypothetical protein
VPDASNAANSSRKDDDEDDLMSEADDMLGAASIEINMVFYLPEEFRPPSTQQLAEPLAQLSLGPAAIVFEKPADKKYRHLKPLYVKGFINGKPVGKMLGDTRVSVNVVPYFLCHKIGRLADDLVKTNIMLNDFKGSPSLVRQVLNMELTIGQKTTNTSFFIIDTHGPYLALLGRDWIHANCCVPSMMHQCMIQWNSDDVKVVHADESCDVAMAEA